MLKSRTVKSFQYKDSVIQKANVTIHTVNHSLVTSLVVTSFNDRLEELNSRPLQYLA